MQNHAPEVVEGAGLTQICDATNAESAAIFLATVLTPSSDIGVHQAHRGDQETTDAMMIDVTIGAMIGATDTNQRSLQNYFR